MILDTMPFLFDGRCLVLVIAMAAVIVAAKLCDDKEKK